MFDLTTATKSQLVNLYRDVLSRIYAPVPAVSTMMRKRNEDLITWIKEYMEATDLEVSDDGVFVEMAPEEEEIVELATVEPATVEPATKTTKMGRTPAVGDDAVITVLVEKFPGREGSASMERRKLYKSGMTVGQFLAAADKNGRGALRKAIARGWVKVTPAA